MVARRYRLSATLTIVALVGSLDGCLPRPDRVPLLGDPGSSEPGSSEPVASARDGVGTVTSITDGDTLRLEVGGGELRVRLIGIDTPEVYPDVECWGPEAIQALASLAPVGSQLGFAYDRDERDRYDRELMYLYTPEGVFINASLVEQGYAEAIVVQPNDRHIDQLRTLERRAQEQRLGLWGNC